MEPAHFTLQYFLPVRALPAALPACLDGVPSLTLWTCRYKYSGWDSFLTEHLRLKRGVSLGPLSIMKLKAALLGCTLLAAMTTAQGQFYFDAEDSFAAGQAQTLLNHDFQLTCDAIAKSISPASQVFPPGGFSSLSRHPLFSKSAVISCQARRNSPRICPTGPTRALK